MTKTDSVAIAATGNPSVSASVYTQSLTHARQSLLKGGAASDTLAISIMKTYGTSGLAPERYLQNSTLLLARLSLRHAQATQRKIHPLAWRSTTFTHALTEIETSLELISACHERLTVSEVLALVMLAKEVKAHFDLAAELLEDALKRETFFAGSKRPEPAEKTAPDSSPAAYDGDATLANRFDLLANAMTDLRDLADEQEDNTIIADPAEFASLIHKFRNTLLNFRDDIPDEQADRIDGVLGHIIFLGKLCAAGIEFAETDLPTILHILNEALCILIELADDLHLEGIKRKLGGGAFGCDTTH
jgi:hypothetical protein